MQRFTERSKTASRPSGRRPRKNSLPAWYVVNARLIRCRTSQDGKPGELVTPIQGSAVEVEED